MNRTKKAQASKPSIRPLIAPVPVHLEVARMAFLIAATITLLVLVDLAHNAGLSIEKLQLTDPAAARSLGHAGGVPHYVFNQRETETGAVPAEHLLRLMRAAARQIAGVAVHG